MCHLFFKVRYNSAGTHLVLVALLWYSGFSSDCINLLPSFNDRSFLSYQYSPDLSDNSRVPLLVESIFVINILLGSVWFFKFAVMKLNVVFSYNTLNAPVFVFMSRLSSMTLYLPACILLSWIILKKLINFIGFFQRISIWSFCFLFFFKIFIYLFFWLRWVFVAARGLSLVAASRGSSSLQFMGFSFGRFSCCGAQALAVRASVVVARGLSSCSSRAPECRLSSYGTRAQLLRGMWDLPRPGLEPVSPALAGRLPTLCHQGSPFSSSFVHLFCFPFHLLSSPHFLLCYFFSLPHEYKVSLLFIL